MTKILDGSLWAGNPNNMEIDHGDYTNYSRLGGGVDMNAFRWFQLYALCILTAANALGLLYSGLAGDVIWYNLIGLAASVYLWVRYKNILWAWGRPHIDSEAR